MQRSALTIVLCDRDPGMCVAWKQETGLPAILGDVFGIEAEAVVSPANSFGFMDGNVDYRISERLGWDVQKQLQSDIREMYDGELLVGQAHAVPTNDPVYKWVISAPTMRVPKNILDPTDVYLAARAAVRCALRIGASSLIFTGMGTGCGGVAHRTAAKLMDAGINAALTPPAFPSSWRKAQSEHFLRLRGIA